VDTVQLSAQPLAERSVYWVALSLRHRRLATAINLARLRPAEEGYMTVNRFFRKTGRGLAVAAAILAAIGLTTVPRPADAGGGWGGGGISPGAAVGLGLGAFALGSAQARKINSGSEAAVAS